MTPPGSERRKDQPIPAVTAADVERLVGREFGPDEVGQARAILGCYGTEPYQREPDRVRVAVLKLAAGDLERLQHYIEVACTDHRDVLAFAEYPAYFGTLPAPAGETERKELFDVDWRQYKDWFER